MSLYLPAILLAAVSSVLLLIYRSRIPGWQKWDTFIFRIAVLILFSPIYIAVGHFIISEAIVYFTPKPLHPTYTTLKKQGFYVFALPEQEVQKRNWQQDITLYSWNIHCGLLTTDTYNPLIVTYRDRDGDQVFVIQHGPWSMIWDHSKAITKEQIPWESSWSNTGKITYYTNSEQNNILRHLYYFSDMQKQGVQIVSSLSVTETLKLIETLEYIGPPVEILDNPWNCQK